MQWCHVPAGHNTNADLIGVRVLLVKDGDIGVHVACDCELLHVHHSSTTGRDAVGNDDRQPEQSVARRLRYVRLDDVATGAVLDLAQLEEVARVHENMRRGNIVRSSSSKAVQVRVRGAKVSLNTGRAGKVEQAGNTVLRAVAGQERVIKRVSLILHNAGLQHLRHAKLRATDKLAGHTGNRLEARAISREQSHLVELCGVVIRDLRALSDVTHLAGRHQAWNAQRLAGLKHLRTSSQENGLILQRLNEHACDLILDDLVLGLSSVGHCFTSKGIKC